LARVILAVLAFGLFAIARFEIPMSLFPTGASVQPRILVLILNCDYGKADAAQLKDLVATYSPDVVQLQGASSRTISVFDPSWHVHRSGQLFTASRYPILASETIEDPSFEMGNSDAMACTILAPASTICLLNVHFATPRDSLESVLSRWWGGRGALEANSRLREQQVKVVSERAAIISDPAVIAGDFNTPVESAILKRYLGAFSNAFSEAGWGVGNTHFTRRTGVRIDHILTSPHWKCRSCKVLSNVASDHRPVLAELELINP
jgi:vancomycin resistance protein VanJ